MRLDLPGPETPEEKGWRESGERDLADARRSKNLDPAALRYLEGALALGEGRFAQAVTALSEYVSQDSWDARALALLGTAHACAGDWERAEQAATRLVELEPMFSRFKFLGDLQLALGRHKEALSAYGEALHRSSNAAEVRCNRALCYQALGQRAEALEDYGVAIRLRPDFARAYNNRGTLRAEVRDFEGAASDFVEALRHDDFYVEAYINLGKALMMLGKIEEAARQFDLAAALDPACADAFLGRGMARKTLGQWDGAIEDFDRVATLKPQDPETYFQRAAAHRKKGNLAQARADLRKAASLAPEAWPRRILVEEHLRELGD